MQNRNPAQVGRLRAAYLTHWGPLYHISQCHLRHKVDKNEGDPHKEKTKNSNCVQVRHRSRNAATFTATVLLSICSVITVWEQQRRKKKTSVIRKGVRTGISSGWFCLSHNDYSIEKMCGGCGLCEGELLRTDYDASGIDRGQKISGDCLFG